MRYLILVLTLAFATASSAQVPPPPSKPRAPEKAEGASSMPASDDVIEIRQLDGTKLKIRGIGNIDLSYTETEDGYTVVLNEHGLYEYAQATAEGDLKPSGVTAHNPDQRSKKEKKFLKKLPQHLRYTGEKLDEIHARNQKLYQNPRKPQR